MSLVQVTIGLCIVGPLSYLKTLDALKFTSALSLLFVLLTTFTIALYASGIPSAPLI